MRRKKEEEKEGRETGGWKEGEMEGCSEGWRGRGVQGGRGERKKIEKEGNPTIFKDLVEPNSAYRSPR